MMRFVCLAVLLAASLSASTIPVTFVDNGSISDSQYNVGPYTLAIDGKEFLALCVDYQHSSNVGQTWDANLSALSDVSNTYYQDAAGYRQAAWLFAQIVTPGISDQDHIDIQHAAWALLSAPQFAAEAGAQYWLNLAAQQELTGYLGFDLSQFRVVSSPLKNRIWQQEMIIRVETPEPATLALLGGGLILIGLSSRLRKAS